MPCTGAPLFNDVLRRPSPRWFTALMAELMVPHGDPQLVTTSAQQYQLSGRERSDGSKAASHLRHYGLCLGDPTQLEEAQICLAHGRRLRRVSPQRGDIPLHVDLCNFLSCKGTSVTKVAEEAERLDKRTQSKSYTSPFWLTQPELLGHFQNPLIQLYTRCSLGHWTRVSEAYEDPNVFVEFDRGSKATTRYANLDEFRTQPNSALPLFACMSFFRMFSPINVHTRRSFDACVEWRLRVECQRTGCWCSIWGTAEDYDKCGFSTLDGALGVDVFDALGNPLFLINAFCTTAPLEIFASCYPHDCIADSRHL
ncbi:hypothetical protein CUR178_04342 [Leishmania enriettii]|uniref:Trypanosoma Tc-38 (p38) protein domain-containing protein n=1 Tax=Leishmania enriettii TaxID=5663 RepID=A0A836H2X2_LEIEN|nr:hypothetical protein CUR178_04342 [Leishmania enriettii]